MQTCENCDYGILCPTWGEWKCAKKQRRVQYPSDLNCADFKKREGLMKPCQCESCLSREFEEEE